MEQFELNGHDFIELHNLLKAVGLCASGGEAKQQVAAGLVSVNGTVELRKRCKIRQGQTVSYGGERIELV